MSLLLVPFLVYAICLLIMWSVWRNTPFLTEVTPTSHAIPVAVIVVGRDEVDQLPNLLSDLSKQSYTSFSLIYVDDYSTDGSLALVESYRAASTFDIQIIDLASADRWGFRSPKMEGITRASEMITGDHVMLMTDADCRVGEYWVERMVDLFHRSDTRLVSGPVAFHMTESWFEKLQIVEFASLVGTGAFGIIQGVPNMCNGANIAYTRAAFDAVGGFKGLEEHVSGDDEFLMHRISQSYPGSIAFVKSTQAIVQTSAKSSLIELIEQRKRWGSKWRRYDNPKAKILAVSVYLFHLLFSGLAVETLIGLFDPLIFLGIFLLKAIPEFLFLHAFLTFLQKPKLQWHTLIMTVIHPFYIVSIGFLGNVKSFEWKGRTY